MNPTQPNYTRHSRSAISDYGDGMIPVSEAKTIKMHQGNTIVVDQDNRIYNCHPSTSNYREETGCTGYPVRWQITSKWDNSCDQSFQEELGFDTFPD